MKEDEEVQHSHLMRSGNNFKIPTYVIKWLKKSKRHLSVDGKIKVTNKMKRFYTFNVGIHYDIIEIIGEGGFGVVAKAVDSHSGRVVAIKKICDVFKDTRRARLVYREFTILKHFNHPHVISLIDVIVPYSKELFQDIYFVMDLLVTDLHQVIYSQERQLSMEVIKYYMICLFLALQHVHQANVLHCDLKPNNLLLTEEGILKISDFGLARGVDIDNPVLSNVEICSRWYRPPELLLASSRASPSIDIWSAGCIMAELLQGSVLFPGSNSMDQLNRIINVLGIPPNTEIFGSEQAKLFMSKLEPKNPITIQGVFSDCPPLAIDLLEKLLVWNPNRRITATEALNHKFFADAINPDMVPPFTPNLFIKEIPPEHLLVDVFYDELAEYHQLLHRPPPQYFQQFTNPNMHQEQLEKLQYDIDQLQKALFDLEEHPEKNLLIYQQISDLTNQLNYVKYEYNQLKANQYENHGEFYPDGTPTFQQHHPFMNY
mmetsp:Transcript_2845/g.4098  ORF Transcript_2845/g.4098 Transcript_2845/m.4098 type:complete len:487 (+) Transcript_2845:84-1544(+)